MSLFKTRDWWVTDVGEGFSSPICADGSLLVSHLNPEDPDQIHVVVGSFSGNLNIYSPQVGSYCFMTSYLIAK